MNRIAAFLFLLCTLSSAAVFGAMPNEACGHCVRPLSVSAETQKKMAKYSLAAYENTDPTNLVKAFLFTPKPMGTSALPMVVYIPGNGELGEVERHFRQPDCPCGACRAGRIVEAGGSGFRAYVPSPAFGVAGWTS